ncbi:MAG: Gfo/Idh/MocA family protein [Leifsonia sp.]
MSREAPAGQDSQAPIGVGIIGCGNISDNYVHGMRRFRELELIGCASRTFGSANALSERTGIKAFRSVDELISDPRVRIVVNLTSPNAHHEIANSALDAGKHLYTEKPITTDFASAQALIDKARRLNLLVGSAPDTFLGSAAQTARAALDAGAVGAPIAASAFIRSTRPEEWHPDPSFLFAPGGGPVLDLGPYYVAALVNLLGSVEAVSAFATTAGSERRITAPGRRVDRVPVTIPTHFSGSLRFTSGAVATVIASFDVWDSELPFIEVYCQSGTISVSDPDQFDGPVRIRKRGSASWTLLDPVIPLNGDPTSPARRYRGLGVLDLARAISGGNHRTSGGLALHTLEVLQSLESAADTGSIVRVSSRVERPEQSAPLHLPSSGGP